MSTICLKKTADESPQRWDFERAKEMDKPWEYWDNGYTRFRKLRWKMEQLKNGKRSKDLDE